ncbi:wall-associated receptor kinase 3 [Quercus suber]|uniref:Wall-associated receptor kinase 3 n=1 Tax=Quercus suber TaxID=58331 RepID=A0AAW0LM40_QUESU
MNTLRSNMLQCFRERKKTIAQTEESFYLKSGGLMLEQLITSFDGKYNSFRIFSKQELEKATNDYRVDGILYKSFHYIVYRGIHDGQKSDVYSFGAVLFEVLTAKRSWNILHNEFEVPEENCRGESSIVGVQSCSWDEIESYIQSYLKANLLDGGNRKQQIECAELAQRCLKMNSDERPTMKETYKKRCINEVAVVSQMNNHNNVVKFYGCCLEIEIPTLVYEFVENENLSDHIFDDCRLLSWESRLKIVTEVAHVVAYDHMGRPKTIVHRDIKSRNIFLDHDYVAKISEFAFSLPIPLDKKYVDAESDVYSFGAVLFEVLTRKRSWNILHNEFEVPEENCRGESSIVGVQSCNWDEIESNIQSYLKANLLDGGNRKQQIECVELAQRCLKTNSDERLTMKEVTQSLREIKRLLYSPL